MKASLLHARHMSLALLIIAVVENGYLHADYSGASPASLGLTRLERDLVRRMNGLGTQSTAMKM